MAVLCRELDAYTSGIHLINYVQMYSRIVVDKYKIIFINVQKYCARERMTSNGTSALRTSRWCFWTPPGFPE